MNNIIDNQTLEIGVLCRYAAVASPDLLNKVRPQNSEFETWEDISFKGATIDENNTYESFFDNLNSQTPQTVNISAELRQELQLVICPDGFIASGNLMDSWQTFCDAALVNIIKKINGEMWCV